MNLSDIESQSVWVCGHCYWMNDNRENIKAGDELQCDYCDSTYIVEGK